MPLLGVGFVVAETMPYSPFFLTLQSQGDGRMGPCVPLSYTSDSGVARILSTGGGGGQNGNFCTLNAIIRGRLL